MSSITNTAAEVDAVVIGAGFSGLYMLHRLRDELGLDVKVFEAGAGVGGAWYWSRYPGARCDSDGFVYCYSFSKELLQDWQWKGKYPEHFEIRAYLEHVADRFDLKRSIAFETRVTSAIFDEETGRWLVSTDKGDRLSAQFLITGIGQLAISRYVPSIDGFDSFKGQWYHTGDWPENIDLAGKRVGIVGTGSSGVQAIPVIARQAQHLTVFQRSAQYSIPAHHETATKGFWDEVKANYDDIWDKARNSAGGFPWQHNGKKALEVSDEERTATYEALWAEGGVKFALGSFRDISYDLDANQTVSDFIRGKIRETVKDPATREKLVPHHPFLSRRPIVDTDYYETYNRDNVELVDVGEAPIVEITPRGIRTTEGEYDLDVIVFATGYDAVTGPFFNIDIRGRDGLKLRDAWADGPGAYLGIQTVGFPNLMMIVGPGSTIGNLPMTIETHVDWITDCIRALRADDIATIEPTAAAQADWAEHVAHHAQRSLMPLADSWFNGSNIPGKPRTYLFYLGHFGQYRERLRDIAETGWPGFEFGRQPMRAEAG